MAVSMNSVQDSTVNYFLFPKLSDLNSNASCESVLEDVVDDYFVKLSPFLGQYIWHKDPFSLKINSDDKEIASPHIKGQTEFGDNVEDEWFIVFLLFHLSKQQPDLVIKVSDSDGEFLLIEAADYLPKWLNPESSENRVYIYQGKVHIVPIARTPAELTFLPSGTPSIADAITTIRTQSSITCGSPSIQNAILKRIDGYPEKIVQLQHRAHCYVPATVSVLLKHDPSLLSTTVQAFCQRDPIDLKACRIMKYFPPETRVMAEVVFTRCLYAQLVQQDYKPDRKVGWNLPPRNSSNFLSNDLGMKLACGFEILAAGDKKVNYDEADNGDFVNDIRWTRYLKSLKDKDYFHNEIEGSRMYRHLLEQAKRFFCQSVRNSDLHLSVGAQILQLLYNLEIDYEKLKEEAQNLKPPDSDKWMNITESDLEEYLKVMENGKDEDRVDSSLGETITNSLKSFVNHTSGLEGAEIPKNKNSERIDFDADHFGDSMAHILDFSGLEPESDESSSMTSYSGDEIDDDELRYREPDGANQPSVLVEEMKQYMDQMDRELAKTDVGLSFEREAALLPHLPEEEADDINDESDDFRPVDIDLTALKNILESYDSQHGLPGPASNLLASMGISLPENHDS